MSVTPDWTYWRQIGHIPIDGAVALSLGIDPSALDAGAYDNRLWFPTEQSEIEYYRRLYIAKSHMDNREFFRDQGVPYDQLHQRPIYLADFVKLAQHLSWALPDELEQLAAGGEGPRASNSGGPLPAGQDAHEQHPAGGEGSQRVEDGDAATDHGDQSAIVREPFLDRGHNGKAAVLGWVTWQARALRVPNDSTETLANRIVELANREGYLSARGRLTVANVQRMLPRGVTGGRGRSR